jgi:hypothetical protein
MAFECWRSTPGIPRAAGALRPSPASPLMRSVGAPSQPSDAHRDALLAALAERLRVERHVMADGAESVSQGHRGGEAQRERAGSGSV